MNHKLRHLLLVSVVTLPVFLVSSNPSTGTDLISPPFTPAALGQPVGPQALNGLTGTTNPGFTPNFSTALPGTNPYQTQMGMASPQFAAAGSAFCNVNTMLALNQFLKDTVLPTFVKVRDKAAGIIGFLRDGIIECPDKCSDGEMKQLTVIIEQIDSGTCPAFVDRKGNPKNFTSDGAPPSTEEMATYADDLMALFGKRTHHEITTFGVGNDEVPFEPNRPPSSLTPDREEAVVEQLENSGIGRGCIPPIAQAKAAIESPDGPAKLIQPFANELIGNAIVADATATDVLRQASPTSPFTSMANDPFVNLALAQVQTGRAFTTGDGRANALGQGKLITEPTLDGAIASLDQLNKSTLNRTVAQLDAQIAIVQDSCQGIPEDVATSLTSQATALRDAPGIGAKAQSKTPIAVSGDALADAAKQNPATPTNDSRNIGTPVGRDSRGALASSAGRSEPTPTPDATHGTEIL